MEDKNKSLIGIFNEADQKALGLFNIKLKEQRKLNGSYDIKDVLDKLDKLEYKIDLLTEEYDKLNREIYSGIEYR